MNKHKMMFFAPDEGGGDGGTETSKGAAVMETQVEGVTPTVEEPKVETPPTATIDPKQFAKEFGDVIGEHFKKAGEEKPKDLTPEEAKKLLKVWEPDDAWYARYDNIQTRKDAVNEMRDALVGQADTLAQYRLQEIVKQLEGKFSPALEAMQRMEATQREGRFHEAYPVLAKPELRPLIQAVADDLKSKGKTYDNEDDLFKALASGVEAVIKVNNPEFKLTAAGTATTKAKSNNSIPTTTPGASGGVGTGHVTTPVKSKGISVFLKE